MSLLRTSKRISQEIGLKPARSRGQNFLVDALVYADIIDEAELSTDDKVLEVGPGLGFLTERLADVAGEVVAVEIDKTIYPYLRDKFSAEKNVRVINEDILDFDPSSQGLADYKIVANLPYNITSIFLRKFLERENKPKMMVLMLQKEVGERICARPGKMSLLAVSVQYYSDPEYLFTVPKEAFWPQPEVASCVVRLEVRRQPRHGSGSRPSINNNEASGKPEAQNYDKKFFRLVKIGFSSRRKMLKNNLASGYHVDNATAEKWLNEAGFDSKIRAQDLAVEDWKKLLQYVE